MRFRAYIAALLISAAAVCLFSACEAEKDDSLRVVDYSYILQRNTDNGSEFAFYMYAYSYVRGPISDFQIGRSGRILEERMVREDLFETEESFGSFRDAVATHTYTAVNERNQTVTSEISHILDEERTLGDIHVSDITFDGTEIVIRVSNVDNANYYGYFLIPATGEGEEMVFHRASSGRPYLQEAIYSYNLDGRTIYPSEQILAGRIEARQYEGYLKVVPVAVYESDFGRIIIESDYYIVIDAGRLSGN